MSRNQTSRELSREILMEAFKGTGTSQYLIDQLEAAIDARSDGELSTRVVRELVAPVNEFSDLSKSLTDAAPQVVVQALSNYLQTLAPAGFRFQLAGVVHDNFDAHRINVYVADATSKSMVPTRFADYNVRASIWTRA